MLRCITGAVLVLVLQFDPAFAAAQAPSELAIRGHVADPTSAPVVGAKVAVASEPAGFVAATLTDDRGDFAVAVPPGIYLVMSPPVASPGPPGG